jgi:MOB kinase activator 1
MVCDGGVPACGVGEGFPPYFTYAWADGVKIKKSNAVKCSGPEYVDYVMTWMEGTINDSAVFPTSSGILTAPVFSAFVFAAQ